jgi:hypothetical protein
VAIKQSRLVSHTLIALDLAAVHAGYGVFSAPDPVETPYPGAGRQRRRQDHYTTPS